MSRPATLALALWVALAAACTGGTAPPPTPSPPGPPPASLPTGSAALTLPVVATTTGPTAEDDATYLEGMRLAVRVVNGLGGVGGRPVALDVIDDGGDPAQASAAIGRLLVERVPAIVYAGPGTALTPLRLSFAEARVPVMLLGGDLYTSKGLFRQVFQTTAPWEWQVHVIARYLVVDRRASRIVFAGTGPEAPAAREAARAAVAYWGGRLSAAVTIPAGGSLDRAVAAARSADAVIDFGGPGDSIRLVQAIRAAVTNPPRIAASAALLSGGGGSLPPGTIACYPYAWAGWAQPIPRVEAFIERLQAFAGHGPMGFEQEGYDAVRAVVAGLRRTGGRGGDPLTSALEGLNGVTYSSMPIVLGPDDHVLLPRDELGLFAVAGPHERLDPWQAGPAEPWRALMRTFTTDGQRDSILDQDRPVFFPHWRENQPGPYYWESRYGIVTRTTDRVH